MPRSVNISVQDASAERQRFADQGLTVTELQRFEGVVEFFELTDLDGNKIVRHRVGLTAGRRQVGPSAGRDLVARWRHRIWYLVSRCCCV